MSNLTKINLAFQRANVCNHNKEEEESKEVEDVENVEESEEMEEVDYEDFSIFNELLEIYLENRPKTLFRSSKLNRYFKAINIQANMFRYSINADDKLCFEFGYGTFKDTLTLRSLTRKQIIDKLFKL